MFILFVAVPAYLLNKWMLRITRPRESFPRLFLYMALSVAVALAFSAVFIFIILLRYPLPGK